jgi:hypothetical protein
MGNTTYIRISQGRLVDLIEAQMMDMAAGDGFFIWDILMALKLALCRTSWRR